MKEISAKVVEAPIKIGDIIYDNVCGIKLLLLSR